MIGEHPARDGTPLHGPGGRAVDQLEPAHEDLVDASRERRREALRHRSHEVRVAGDERLLARELEHTVELLAPAVDVEVHDLDAADGDRVGDASELRLTHDVRAEILRGLAREDRVRLAGHRGP